jgi:hypothetical protein
MRLPVSSAVAAAAIVFAPGVAPAGEGCDSAQSGQSVVHHIFDEADRDDSGTLSPAEYAAAGLERFGVSFAETDADGDGETSQAEYLELYRRHHPAEERISL